MTPVEESQGVLDAVRFPHLAECPEEDCPNSTPKLVEAEWASHQHICICTHCLEARVEPEDTGWKVCPWAQGLDFLGRPLTSPPGSQRPTVWEEGGRVLLLVCVFMMPTSLRCPLFLLMLLGSRCILISPPPHPSNGLTGIIHSRVSCPFSLVGEDLGPLWGRMF